MNKMKRVNFYCPTKQLKTLRKLASGRGVSLSEVIRQALDEYEENRRYVIRRNGSSG